ncbi:hypothetical protein AYI68_g560 [Smittium mucronatum]|uniref:Zn(2)-C6 fungal-type domain-containing protein n=1 Tax=Smittium mucronatum TaxID=133383 RepID=A0A1R0H849_9FUNG|nr:hypothetical protein AYI68_g560 [Smittium mucronatum]
MTNTKSKCEVKVSDFGKMLQFRTLKQGATFYSCVECKKRRYKCDGMRPNCNQCLKHDRTCNYIEYQLDPQSGAETVEQKLANINKVLERLKFVSAIEIKRDCTQRAGDLLENIQKYIDTENDICLSVDLALELGYSDQSDKLLDLSLDYFFKKSTFSMPLSKALFKNRLSKGNVPEYLKYAILTFCSKLADSHEFFKNHLYMCGSNFAAKSLELLLEDLNDINVDKVYALSLLSFHYSALAQVQTVSHLISKLSLFIFSLAHY